MKRIYSQIFAVMIICLGTLHAKTIREFIFDGTDLGPQGLQFVKFGDQTSQIMDTEGAVVNGRQFKPQVIVNTTERSWGYFICDVPAKDIPAGGKSA